MPLRERGGGAHRPKARLLNIDQAYEGGTENQLAHWTRIGILTGAPDPAERARSSPVASDPDAGTVEQRARAYLEVELRLLPQPHRERPDQRSVPLAPRSPIRPRSACASAPSRRAPARGDASLDIVPGDPDASVIPYRMAATAPAAAMPQIGRSVVDAHGLALVSQWIAEMQGTCP